MKVNKVVVVVIRISQECRRRRRRRCHRRRRRRCRRRRPHCRRSFLCSIWHLSICLKPDKKEKKNRRNLPVDEAPLALGS